MLYEELIEGGAVLTRNGTLRLGMTTYTEHKCNWCEGVCWVRRADLTRRKIGFCGNRCSQAWQAIPSIGSRHLNSNGYWVLRLPDHPNAKRDGIVLEHRYIMSEHLGRPLEPHEVVHHKDRNRQNNAIGNLELISSNSEHQKQHLVEGELYQLKLQGLRRCSRCREVKPLDGFALSKPNPHGYSNQCKACNREHHERRNPNRVTREEGLKRAHQRKWEGTEDRALFQEGKRRCKKCDEIKELDLFVHNPSCRGGHSHECKACRAVRLKKQRWA